MSADNRQRVQQVHCHVVLHSRQPQTPPFRVFKRQMLPKNEVVLAILSPCGSYHQYLGFIVYSSTVEVKFLCFNETQSFLVDPLPSPHHRSRALQQTATFQSTRLRQQTPQGDQPGPKKQLTTTFLFFQLTICQVKFLTWHCTNTQNTEDVNTSEKTGIYAFHFCCHP